MDGWRAGYYHTLLFLAWNYHKEIVRFRHGIHDRLLDGLEGKFGRGSLGIYSLFVSCLISVFLDQFGWLVWVASAPASCTHSHDRTYNTVRYVLHIHEPPNPSIYPLSQGCQGMEWVRIPLPCERALTTHLKATTSQCYSNLDATSTIIWPNWILDLDLDLDLDSLPTPLFLFLFLFRPKLYSIKETFFEQRCFDACDFLLCYELPDDIILPHYPCCLF
jgi:hypothetical protein